MKTFHILKHEGKMKMDFGAGLILAAALMIFADGSTISFLPITVGVKF